MEAMIQEADARAAVQGYLGSDEFELDEFPEGWRVVRATDEGYRGAVTLAVERSSGTLLRFPSSIPPDRVAEEFAAVRADGRAVGEASPARREQSSPPRLSLVASDLVDALRAADDEHRRRVALAACTFAVERNDLAQDATIVEALRALANGAVGDAPERQSVHELTDRLDRIAWDIQDRVESGKESETEYLAAFKRARSAAAVGFAFEPDVLTAAAEALYEAHHATQDLDRLRVEVRAALA